MTIYTKRGDKGQTDLLAGERVDKDSIAISTIGSIDELNSLIGISRGKAKMNNVDMALEYLQNALFEIGAIIAGSKGCKIPAVKNIENVIDELEKKLPPLTHFILPNGHEGAAFIHHARSVCRRVERLIVALSKKSDIDPNILIFINRTSDFLFVIARYINHTYMVKETEWQSVSLSENNIESTEVKSKNDSKSKEKTTK